nr:hypothetical protein [Paraburkholderia sp. BL8N3]
MAFSPTRIGAGFWSGVTDSLQRSLNIAEQAINFWCDQVKNAA